LGVKNPLPEFLCIPEFSSREHRVEPVNENTKLLQCSE
jgi:hypothetical protein